MLRLWLMNDEPHARAWLIPPPQLVDDRQHLELQR